MKPREAAERLCELLPRAKSSIREMVCGYTLNLNTEDGLLRWRFELGDLYNGDFIMYGLSECLRLGGEPICVEIREGVVYASVTPEGTRKPYENLALAVVLCWIALLEQEEKSGGF